LQLFFFFSCCSCFINPDDMSCVRSRQRGEKDFENGATWDGELGLYYYNTRLCMTLFSLVLFVVFVCVISLFYVEPLNLVR
jgi:hypothetical protein